MGKKNTIYWDFDGVIVNSNPIKTKILLETVQEMGVSITDDIKDYLRNSVAETRYNRLYTILEDKGEVLVAMRKFSEILDEYIKNWKISNEVLDIIRAWKGKQYIISNAPCEEIRSILKINKILSHFEMVHGYPEEKRTVLKSYLIKEKSVDTNVFVGDTIADFQVAKDSGVDFLGFAKFNTELINYSSNLKVLDTYSKLREALYE